MDKISGIIPSTARVTTVDLKDSNNIRATLPNRVDTGPGLKPDGMMAVQPDWRNKDAKHSAIVTEVANNFFMKNTKAAVADEHEEHEEPVHVSIPQPEGLFPKGSFIDRSA